MRPGSLMILLSSLSRPTLPAFSALFTFEPLSRSIIVTVVPLMALEKFGSTSGISQTPDSILNHPLLQVNASFGSSLYRTDLNGDDRPELQVGAARGPGLRRPGSAADGINPISGCLRTPGLTVIHSHYRSPGSAAPASHPPCHPARRHSFRCRIRYPLPVHRRSRRCRTIVSS